MGSEGAEAQPCKEGGHVPHVLGVEQGGHVWLSSRRAGECIGCCCWMIMNMKQEQQNMDLTWCMPTLFQTMALKEHFSPSAEAVSASSGLCCEPGWGVNAE